MGIHSLQQSFAESDGLGRAIFLILGGLSILAWATIGERLWTLRSDFAHLRRLRLRFQALRDRPLSLDLNEKHPDHHLASGLYHSLRASALGLINTRRQIEAPGATSTRATLSSADLDLLANQVTTYLQKQREKLHRHLYLLSSCVTLAPFLGLLGTVWGILLSFSALRGQSGGPSSEEVLQGLSLALATTVVGLFVAIPAVVGYNLLKCAIGKVEVELEDFAIQLLTSVELHYRNSD